MNVGSCYDDLVTNEMKHFVPRNKSYLKEAEINPKPAKTKEEMKKERA